MKNAFAIVLFLTSPFFLFAQHKSNDVTLICQTIEHYFDGYVKGDLNKLTKAFDLENGMMKSVSTDKNNVQHAENIFFKTLIPKWASREKRTQEELKNCSLDILNIDVVDSNIGSAKIDMRIGDVTYTDILSLQKLNSEWKITSKIFVKKNRSN